MAAFSTFIAKRKTKGEELLAQLNLTVARGGTLRERRLSGRKEMYIDKTKEIKMRHWIAMPCKTSVSHGCCKDQY
jgi:hypothetical protein